MKTILTIIFIITGCNCFAQLASEKPMNEVFTKPIRQKLDQPKANATAAKPLPSEAPMPRQVTVAASKAPANTKNESPEQRRKRLPSNAMKLPVVKPPKK